MGRRLPESVRDVPGAGGVRESNAAAVLAAARTDGPLSRAEIARLTGLSMPTVSRQVTALTDLALLREAPEMATGGGIGRPTVPVRLDDDVIAACGVHIGIVTTTYGLTNLSGTLLGSERIPTPQGSATEVLRAIGDEVSTFLAEWPQRRIIGIGLAIGGQVDAERGLLDHGPLGWRGVPARAVLEQVTGLPVHLDGHVPAMATAELLFGVSGRAASSLYFYAREMAGVAIAVDGVLHRGPGQSGSIAHLPVGTDVRCECGRTGCLEATVAERAVVERARSAGIITGSELGDLVAAADRDPRARELLTQRARALGRAIAMTRDLVNPELVVLGGQAITEAPAYLDTVREEFAAATTLPGTDLITVTRFGRNVQAMAACTGLLTQLYDHPLSLLGAGAPSERRDA
ncbi:MULTISPECIES: ROK family transcriptional regulator [Prauserella salsuginis group]|uniref:ROK family protein n=2 Tax=Prauserella salsuginis group TaxID=2893672 RepID=A0ABW6G401_9PSEU|nr:MULTISPECIES: ROK family transcriptional regulator [Prauserella salsuginis group]MBB3664856.1 putative NBD/HSP70 family sugar kinase [Prauserella sediminis]MCR3718326.1 Sugar kinase of the NBD/HSP70 family, may containing an N-terminal HTH domain [Prauserella flava]MCR3732896.1 Sugar kinase of the NBD/HSP70 family, may containing an N-terminal HTH domain [Prauserella salsuginis]